MTYNQLIKIFICLTFLITLTSCAATRVSTTEHTAVEQALLTYSAKKAFHSVDLSSLKNEKVFIEKVVLPHRFPRNNLANNTQWHEINPEYLKQTLENNLLSIGIDVVDNREQASAVLRLVCDISAIDDSEFVMGIPSIPVPVATGGATLQTPEISLFSSKRQIGKSKFTLIAKNKESGKMVFFKKSKAARKYYTRWSLLIILGWRVTDLGAPF